MAGDEYATLELQCLAIDRIGADNNPVIEFVRSDGWYVSFNLQDGTTYIYLGVNLTEARTNMRKLFPKKR